MRKPAVASTRVRAVISRLSLFWKRFTPLEERLLGEVRRVLPVGAQPMFDAQVGAINHVQRLPPSWSEIDFYRRPNWTGVPLFPCTDEFRLAEVRFRIRGRSYKAVLSSISGHIFDFAITPGARTVAFEAWDGMATSALLGDPLRAPTGNKEPETLPPVWQEFLARHAGEQPSGWVLHDRSTAYRVVVNDAEYVILAEREGPEFILHRVEPVGERLYYLRHHDGVPQALDRIESVL
jgi:hypothetical protein